MEEDIDGNTPLHVACMQGSEFSAFWLIGFGADLNKKNKFGDTPLHLLMQNSQNLRGSKTIKELIFKGANHQLKNNLGKEPYDYIDLIENITLQKELRIILGKQKCSVPCLDFGAPVTKIDRTRKTMITFVLAMTLGVSIMQLFIFPFEGPDKLRFPIYGLFALCVVTFMISSCKDPGHVKKSNKISFLKLNKYFDPSFLCASCEILKPEDSRHCYICKKCVSRFDHHCQWINNCVGVNNHGTFILFLILQWFFLLSVVAMCTYNFLIVYAFKSFRPST